MRLTFIIVAMLFCNSVWAQGETALRRRNYNHNNGIALQEFDPVSYFKGPGPVKGKREFRYTHEGITYYFANAANLEEFKKSPSKFEPAYGGWCAYAMAEDGRREKVDPTTYKIIDGRLYLFFNFSGKSNLLKWNKNIRKYKADADANWKKKWGG
ncbi:MAG TPA: YHS domain-containing (seleno)protein [Cyclobacteriaceae bacterium]